MAAADEITMSVGASLSVCATIGGTYTVVAAVKSFKNKIKRGTSDASFITDVVARKKPKGRYDVGELTVEVLYGKTQYAALNGYMTAGTQLYWKITLADGSVAGPLFGALTETDLDVPEDDPVTSSITIDLGIDPTGGATGAFTAGS